MLIKHPALTMVGGLGMAVGIAVSVGFLAVSTSFINPTLPLDDGNRIVALENRYTTRPHLDGADRRTGRHRCRT